MPSRQGASAGISLAPSSCLPLFRPILCSCGSPPRVGHCALLAELIERNCHQATRFAQGLRDAGYPILNEVALNQVLVSFGEPERTRAVIAAIQDDGTCWCGPTVWQGQTAMRISVSSWRTTDEDVERSLAAMIRLAREV